jgi:hypothetical protein
MVPRKKRKRYISSAYTIAKEQGIVLDQGNWEQIWSILDTYPEVTFIYAIVDVNNRKVKIGKSKNPGARLKQLKTGNSSVLRLAAYRPHVTPFTEKEVHKKLSDSRVDGEWFVLNNETQKMIHEIRGNNK